MIYMNGWVTSLNPQKHQRKMNYYMRSMNKNVEKDELWNGRFYCRQVYSPQKYVYEDRSGMEYHVCLRFIDKKTGKYYDKYDTVNSWCMWNGSKIWETMNWFIVEFIDAWAEKPNPYEEVWH